MVFLKASSRARKTKLRGKGWPRTLVGKSVLTPTQIAFCNNESIEDTGISLLLAPNLFAGICQKYHMYTFVDIVFEIRPLKYFSFLPVGLHMVDLECFLRLRLFFLTLGRVARELKKEKVPLLRL